MANKMADKKKNAGRSQVAEPQAREKEQPVKTMSEERKQQPKQESKAARRDTKGSSSLLLRIRNSRAGRFTFDAYYELRHKVTWPTFEEARNMTITVIALSLVISVILGAADFGLVQLFLLINGK